MKHLFMLTLFLSMSAQAVIFGTTVPKKSDLWPNTVALTIWAKGKGRIAICSGSLIHRKVVLTAAHCIRGLEERYDNWKKRLRIYRGTGRDGRFKLFDHRKMSKVEHYLVSGHYRLPLAGESRDQLADVALLFLEKELDDIPTVPLYAGQPLLTDLPLYQVGYGLNAFNRTGQKKFSVLELNPNVPSPAGYQYAQDLVKLSPIDEAQGKACQGDSGGPIFATDTTGQLVQVGVLSQLRSNNLGSSIDFCRATYGIIAVNVAEHLCWIKQNSGILLDTGVQNCY